MLRDAGQYSITTSIMHKPWNGQTEDHFDSMVTRIRHIDGSWTYDYAVFDRWVEFMMNEVGIDRLISCYTMIPWNLQFDYYDEATNRIQFVKAKPATMPTQSIGACSSKTLPSICVQKDGSRKLQYLWTNVRWKQ